MSERKCVRCGSSVDTIGRCTVCTTLSVQGSVPRSSAFETSSAKPYEAALEWLLRYVETYESGGKLSLLDIQHVRLLLKLIKNCTLTKHGHEANGCCKMCSTLYEMGVTVELVDGRLKEALHEST